MSASSTQIPVQATEMLVDALNGAVELEGDAATRITFLLQRLQRLLKREMRCALWLMEDLMREPAPRIVSRIVVRPASDHQPAGDIESAQRALEDAAPVNDFMVRSVLRTIRTPVTLLLSASAPMDWFQSVLVDRHLAQVNSVDCIVSMWAASEDRAIVLVCHRREVDPAFTDGDVSLVSLMLRATAPFVDRDIFKRTHDPNVEGLSPREREILLLLLAGEGEKQIAADLHRSVHTIHTFVRHLYREFHVSSRGELMALFVDKAALASIRQDLPT